MDIGVRQTDSEGCFVAEQQTPELLMWRKSTPYTLESYGLSVLYTIAAFKCQNTWIYRASKKGQFIGSATRDLELAKQLCFNNYQITGIM